MSERDTIYRDGQVDPGSFRFDRRVVEVFPDMIGRSVPGYGLIVPMIGQLARRFARPRTRLHDLGCSLGAVAFAMRSRVEAEGTRIVATDSSQDMIERLRSLLEEAGPGVPVEAVCGDIRDVDFTDSSVVVSNFTLQFLAPEARDALLRAIANGLCPGGALILSEKIRFGDPALQERHTEWHHDFKRLQGYSDLEIARKRSALERVLLPETEERHIRRLEAAGFTQVTRWFQCFSFVSFVAER